VRRLQAIVGLKLSRRIARFNRAVVNPIQLSYAWLVPPWTVIVHRGRRSGRVYRTPVGAFKHGRTLAVVILYGERSDWVKNVLAGGAQVVRGGRTYELERPRVMDVRGAAGISPLARAAGRLSGKLLVGSLSEPKTGFGRGPAA
jgi:deazaflavin-dependent oxidoreductase (nitroreductase family)